MPPIEFWLGFGLANLLWLEGVVVAWWLLRSVPND